MSSGEGRERRFIAQHGHTEGKGTGSISAICSVDVCFRFKWRKNWGEG
jgi:hypothetical protein